MSEQEDTIRLLLGPTYDEAKRIACHLADRGENEGAAMVGVLLLKLANVSAAAQGDQDQRPASSGKALTGKAQGAWLPISTAPKDGTWILASTGNDVLHVAWSAEHNGWFDEYGMREDPWSGNKHHPVKWQPRPAPPASSGQESA
jgi:hypothetical protein